MPPPEALYEILWPSKREREIAAFPVNEISAQSFLTEAFGNPLGSWTSAPSGHGCPPRNACFPRVSKTLTEVLSRDVRPNDPRISTGYPAPKTSSLRCFFVPAKKTWEGQEDQGKNRSATAGPVFWGTEAGTRTVPLY